MSVKVKLKGFEKFKKDLLANVNINDTFKATIYNNLPYAKVLEYGSIPGKKPWPKPKKKTGYRFDEETNQVKVFSKIAHGMMRNSKKAARGKMIYFLGRIKLDKPLEKQIKSAINRAAAFWVKRIRQKAYFTPFNRAWRITKAK